MLNPFPGLLDFGIFAPLIVRLAAAAVFLYVGVRTLRCAQDLAGVPLPLVGARAWAPYLAGLAELALAVMFFAGWYTQIAAIAGIIAMLKYAAYKLWWPRTLTEYFPLSPIAALLLVAICLSLLLSGAGQPAFDIPL